MCIYIYVCIYMYIYNLRAKMRDATLGKKRVKGVSA